MAEPQNQLLRLQKELARVSLLRNSIFECRVGAYYCALFSNNQLVDVDLFDTCNPFDLPETEEEEGE